MEEAVCLQDGVLRAYLNARSKRKKAAVLSEQRLFLQTGGESGIRTPDLRIMIPSL
jgi:hypothetical protein